MSSIQKQGQFQIKIMKGSQVYECTPIFEHQINKTSIQTYLLSFNIQEPYTIVYVDADGDQITVECEQDYQVAKTTMVQIQKCISFLVRPSNEYFQKLSKIQIEQQLKVSEQSEQLQSDKLENTKQNIPSSQCQQKSKIQQSIPNQDNQQIKIYSKETAQNNLSQINLSAHALPTQNQLIEPVKEQFQFDKTQTIEAYPIQCNHFEDQQKQQIQIQSFKNQEEYIQQLDEKQVSEIKEDFQIQVQEQVHEKMIPKGLQEELDNEQEPLIKPTTECAKTQKQKQTLTKKKSKSKSKKEEYMTRQETLKLIKQQIKKALLLNKKQQKPQQIKQSQKQHKIQSQQKIEKFTSNWFCSICHKQLQVPYYINSYKNLKICVKCEKKDKSPYPLIKIRQDSESKVLFGCPQVIYQTDLSQFNVDQVPSSKRYNIFLDRMSHKMKAQMRKLIQEALASETKEKRAKEMKKVKTKKVCTNFEDQQEIQKK